MRLQVGPLLGGEQKSEVFREPLGVALDLLIEALDGDAIEGGKIGVEQDGLAAEAGDALFGGAGQDQFVVGGGFHGFYGRCSGAWGQAGIAGPQMDANFRKWGHEPRFVAEGGSAAVGGELKIENEE